MLISNGIITYNLKLTTYYSFLRSALKKKVTGVHHWCTGYRLKTKSLCKSGQNFVFLGCDQHVRVWEFRLKLKALSYKPKAKGKAVFVFAYSLWLTA
jgi:hypothetical protein